MKNLNEVTRLLSNWLTGMVFVSVTYAAGFMVRLEREHSEKEKPNVLHLIIRSTARFGRKEDWMEFLKSLPLRPRRGEIAEPGLGFRLMLALGTQIQEVELEDDGSLSLFTTDQEVLVIPGTEDVWDESWVLEELKEVAGDAARTVVCSASGEIFFE